MSPMNKIIISIEGNIGVGKSTFISILKSKWNDCEIITEPVDMWKNLIDSNGKNILQTFYDDIPRWAYSFQNVACITRMIKMENVIRNSNANYIFLDRSLETDKNVFEAMLYDQGHMTQLEHQMYNLWYDFYHQYVRQQDKHIYIYLKSNVDTCIKRIKKRGRIEEESISPDYLQGLDNYHDKWLMNEKNVIVIDCNEEFECDDLKQIDMINKIKSKLNVIMSNDFDKNKIEFESDDKTFFNKNISHENI